MTKLLAIRTTESLQEQNGKTSQRIGYAHSAEQARKSSHRSEEEEQDRNRFCSFFSILSYDQ